MQQGLFLPPPFKSRKKTTIKQKRTNLLPQEGLEPQVAVFLLAFCKHLSPINIHNTPTIQSHTHCHCHCHSHSNCNSNSNIHKHNKAQSHNHQHNNDNINNIHNQHNTTQHNVEHIPNANVNASHKAKGNTQWKTQSQSQHTNFVSNTNQHANNQSINKIHF